MAEEKGVLIYAEAAPGKLTKMATEALGGGRKLADELGEELAAVLVGSEVSSLAQEAIAFGADKVYIADHPLLKDYQTDSYVAVMEGVIRQAMPRVVIMGQTSVGRDLAPRLAFRLGTTATLDCIELNIDPGSKLLLPTKPVYGGNIMAVITAKPLPQIATIRARAMSPLPRNDSRQGEITRIDAEPDPQTIRTKVLEKVAEEVTGIKLEEAEVIVSGGRGIGGTEGFQPLRELAQLLKGTIGASRPPCDNGWVPETLQIGLTGKIVAPKLYIAVALSGSSQHISGCSGCQNIIAINKDPEANIFNEARFGVVGDWKKVVPAFTDKVRELLGETA
jgi:electron transfer flavoprotein alpha subunit